MINHIDRNGISFPEIERLLGEWIASLGSPKSVLIIPPDITRKHSRAGDITAYIYGKLMGQGLEDCLANSEKRIANSVGCKLHRQSVGGDPLGTPQNAPRVCIGRAPNGSPPTGNPLPNPSETCHSSLVTCHSFAQNPESRTPNPESRPTVKLLIALGSHVPMDKEECARMFPGVPYSDIIHHDWRKSIVNVGTVPAGFVKDVSGGLCDFPIDVEVNRELISGYDKIISVGQVVPHEVVGMANGNKNIFVGCGGDAMINGSHFLGAVCDMEKLMGRAVSPVRAVFNYAENTFFQHLDITYIQNVLKDGKIHGLFIGKGQAPFETAAKLACELNLTFLDKPIKKAVVYLDPNEYKSTWLGNKAIYRTRMAMADGGELIILAPGVERFGEDPEIDRLIRKFGYVGRDKVLALAKEHAELQNNLSAAAHLIHGSSNGRFSITYAVEKLSREEVEGVGFKYANYTDEIQKYNSAFVGGDPLGAPQNAIATGNGGLPKGSAPTGNNMVVPAETAGCAALIAPPLKEGCNLINGEEIFFIPNPAVGLWAEKKKFS